MTRRILIDTDAGSDDAVALVAALRDPAITVEAITVVAGNVPLPQAVHNTLLCIDMAGTYAPPVYAGRAAPLLRPLFTGEFTHGEDGLGDMGWPPPSGAPAEGHAVDAMIRLAAQWAGTLEIVTLGPLSNLALACLRAPEFAEQVKSVTVMAGTGTGGGNVTPLAEFNLYVDAEAGHIVLHSGLPLTFVPWDVSTEATFITQADLDTLAAKTTPSADFCVRCNAKLKDYNWATWGKVGMDWPDPLTLICALYPEIITETLTTYAAIEHKSEMAYGQMMIDPYELLERTPNTVLVRAVDAARFKELLFARL
ncbi:MAG: nucleoside hydrolase [Anaerolineales bacterium]